MRVIINDNIKEAIIVVVGIYNQYVDDGKLEGYFPVLELAKMLEDEKNVTYTLRSIIDTLSYITICRGNKRTTVFSMIDIDDNYNIHYIFNSHFIKDARKEKISFDFSVFDKIKQKDVLKFYLAVLDNKDMEFSVSELENIFDCEYRFSYFRDFYTQILKPAINLINQESDIEIINFKKIRNKPIYTYELKHKK